MADLNIPNLNKKSDKYIFKNKLTLKRKSKKRLLNECILMLTSSFLLIYVNYIIPNKILLFKSFGYNSEKSLLAIIEFIFYLFKIIQVLFIVISLLLAFVLLLGSLYRILKVLRRKSKNITY